MINADVVDKGDGSSFPNHQATNDLLIPMIPIFITLPTYEVGKVCLTIEISGRKLWREKI